MDALVSYLSDHPLLALALLLVLAGAVASLVKKLVKVALVLLVIFAIAGGAVFSISRDEMEKKSRELLERAGDTGRELLEDAGRTVGTEVKKHARDLLTGDTTGGTRRSDTLKRPARR